MSKTFNKQNSCSPIEPGTYEATVTDVKIFKAEQGRNVRWELDADGIILQKLNCVRASKESKNQLKKDAKIFDIEVNGPSDVNDEYFSSAIGKRVKIDVKEPEFNPKYPIILFKELVKDQAFAMDEAW